MAAGLRRASASWAGLAALPSIHAPRRAPTQAWRQACASVMQWPPRSLPTGLLAASRVHAHCCATQQDQVLLLELLVTLSCQRL